MQTSEDTTALWRYVLYLDHENENKFPVSKIVAVLLLNYHSPHPIKKSVPVTRNSFPYKERYPGHPAGDQTIQESFNCTPTDMI